MTREEIVIIQDIEYYIYKVAHAIAINALAESDIHSILKKDGLSIEEIFLIINAGRILSSDIEEEDDGEPTIPDRKIDLK